MSLAERRPRRLKCLPKRFKDIVPQPLPLLPPVSAVPRPLNDGIMLRAPSPPASNEPQSVKRSLGSRIHQIFQTPKNIFGLFRRYFSETLPTHDPEEHKNILDLSDEPIIYTRPHFADNGNPFEPFPNKSSFRLAD